MIDLLDIKEPLFQNIQINEELETSNDIMQNILNYCVKNEMLNDSIAEKDLMYAKIMGILMPRASETISKFIKLYNVSFVKATDYLYNLSINSNYIQLDRIKKNLKWKVSTEFGELDITVNLSKPEKDPKDIANQIEVMEYSYPKCLLCRENEGFAGNSKYPARQNLRLIPIELGGEEWYFQYSPYLYYDEHCIILSSEHRPMEISKKTFSNLIEFIIKFPHYFIGSNADLPIVGGSILSHDHYQGGRYNFSLEKAKDLHTYTYKRYPEIKISIVKWPMSVIRISCAKENEESIVELSDFILSVWKNYNDLDADILSHSKNTPHNTITPIARINKNNYIEMDLVLRNNRTSKEFQYGIFHPHNNLHHIKKENIGLIEVMGLAILPGRLNDELNEIKLILCGESEYDEQNKSLIPHGLWINSLINKYGNSNTVENAEEIIKNEIGEIFKQVLIDSGVFKCTVEGLKSFNKFMLKCGLNKIF